MATVLEIRDGCPHCGQLVGIRLAASQPEEGGPLLVPLIVDPVAAKLRAVDSWPDHPCPEGRQS